MNVSVVGWHVAKFAGEDNAGAAGAGDAVVNLQVAEYGLDPVEFKASTCQ